MAQEGRLDFEHQMNLAECNNYIGVMYGHAFRWKDAHTHLKVSMKVYKNIFNLYEEQGAEAELMDVVSGMIQTTQTQFDTFLNLPDKMDEAKEAFHKNLALRRYLDRQTALDLPLNDEPLDTDSYRRELQLGQYNSFEQNVAGESKLQSMYEKSLHTYQNMLDEYLSEVNEYAPDGEYINMGFTFVEHDKIYEGSVRSSIGSLLLAMNQYLEAMTELEQAAQLLRESITRYPTEKYQAYGEFGQLIEYSIELELANALLSLSYCLLGLKQWRSAYEAFEEAMSLYETELLEGETPMNNSRTNKNASKGSEKGNIDRLAAWMGSFVKGRLGGEENKGQEGGVSQDNKDASIAGGMTSTQYINLDGYQTMANATSASTR